MELPYQTMRQDRPESIKGLRDLIGYLYLFGLMPSEMTLVEIGSYGGESTSVFCEYFKRVIAIDPWQNNFNPADDSTGGYPMEKVEQIFDLTTAKCRNLWKCRDASCTAAPLFSRIDMIYIDACHTYKAVREDLLAWKDKATIISGHDWGFIDCNGDDGLRRAIIEIMGKEPDATFCDCSWVYLHK